MISGSIMIVFALLSSLFISIIAVLMDNKAANYIVKMAVIVMSLLLLYEAYKCLALPNFNREDYHLYSIAYLTEYVMFIIATSLSLITFYSTALLNRIRETGT